MKMISFTILLFINFHIDPARAQQSYGAKPIAWQFSHSWVAPGMVSFSATAVLAPGWHLYSQHLGDAGPMPTCFTFQPDNTLILTGATIEEGQAITSYDSIYEANITWYKQQVRFSQRMRLHTPQATVRGTIEYMICNRSSCVPDRVTFSHSITP